MPQPKPVAAKQTQSVTVRLPVELVERMDALADRESLDRTSVIEEFLLAGLEANPVTSEQLAKFRTKKQRAGRGLVRPVAPERFRALDGGLQASNESEDVGTRPDYYDNLPRIFPQQRPKLTHSARILGRILQKSA